MSWIPAAASAVGSIASAFGGGGESHYNPVDAYHLQLQYDRNSIWHKTQGAELAGIHPLYALGHSPLNIPPQQIGDGNRMEQMGQALAGAGSAMAQYQSQKQQKQFNALQMKQMAANIQETKARSVATRVQAMNASRDFIHDSAQNALSRQKSNMLKGVGQPRPGTGLNSPVGRISFDQSVDSAQLASDRWGDVVEAGYGLGVLASDVFNTASKFTKTRHKRVPRSNRKTVDYSIFDYFK